MNERIRELAKEAGYYLYDLTETHECKTVETDSEDEWITLEKFAELIVRECCLALWTEECHTSDLAFDEVKRNATKIKEHFGIDPNEITEDMLARSIKWMEEQLEDKKHFGVDE
jgi:hypothetical protein